ncbi:hypothetical protein HZR84_03290 [Hyphobacterium sp. CCMP332]|nr:hypothetical protein HZR84_03290 [Hyphobacterium sp. CCMP332]
MKKNQIRVMTHEEAEKEDQEWFMALSPTEKIREVQRLRILNHGKDSLKPIKKVITIISIED